MVAGSPVRDDDALRARLPAVDACRLDEDDLVFRQQEAVQIDRGPIARFEINFENGLSKGTVARVGRQRLDRSWQRGWLVASAEGDGQRHYRHHNQPDPEIDHPIVAAHFSFLSRILD